MRGLGSLEMTWQQDSVQNEIGLVLQSEKYCRAKGKAKRIRLFVHQTAADLKL